MSETKVFVSETQVFISEPQVFVSETQVFMSTDPGSGGFSKISKLNGTFSGILQSNR
ncbi:hypothetical protein CBFG_03867 [Clostridiales bacterium 1_7_47FAA]|nr:hypothetical protein CBFG_03867 [Clostridiales bacterium 1_7_47FAA]